MSKSDFDRAYREEFQLLQAEVSKKAALAALRRYSDPGLSVGEFLDDISSASEWERIRDLTLLELFQAIWSDGGMARFELRWVEDKVVEALAEIPGAKISVIAEAVGQPKKRVSAALGRLKRDGVVVTTGQRASMVYYLADDGGSDTR